MSFSRGMKSFKRRIMWIRGSVIYDFVWPGLSQAWSNWREETISNLIDPMLRGSSGPVGDILRYIHIALLCVQENVANRPNMGAVLLMLSSHSLSLPVPHNDVNPQILHFGDGNSRIFESSKLTEGKSICSSGNQDLITELHPR